MTNQTEYLPFGTGWPSSVMSRSTSNVVAQFAPGVHTSFQFAALVPNIGSRPRVRGREYVTVMCVLILETPYRHKPLYSE